MRGFFKNFAITVVAAFLAISIGMFITGAFGYSVGAPFVTESDPEIGQVVVGHQKTSAEYLAELELTPDDRLKFKLEGGAWLISVLLAIAFVIARSRMFAIIACSLFAATIIYLKGAEHAAAGIVLAGVAAGLVNWILHRSVRLNR